MQTGLCSRGSKKDLWTSTLYLKPYVLRMLGTSGPSESTSHLMSYFIFRFEMSRSFFLKIFMQKRLCDTTEVRDTN